MVARIPAGRAGRSRARPGRTMAIATGGAVPAGADAVIPLEDVVDHDNEIEIRDAVPVGENVRPQRRRRSTRGRRRCGRRAARPSPARRARRRRRGRHLAARGVRGSPCSRREPSSGVRARSLRPGEIYEANGVILAAQLRTAGAELERLEAVARRRRGAPASARCGPARQTCSSHPAASRSGRTISCARSAASSASRRSCGASRSSLGSRCGSACATGRSCSGCRGTRCRRSSASSCSCGRRFSRFRVPSTRSPGSSRAACCVRPVQTRRGRSSCGPGRQSSDGQVELDVLGGQESHMIARAAGADALVLIPVGSDELPAGSAVSFLRLA